jgi:hypothetical protein
LFNERPKPRPRLWDVSFPNQSTDAPLSTLARCTQHSETDFPQEPASSKTIGATRLSKDRSANHAAHPHLERQDQALEQSSPWHLRDRGQGNNRVNIAWGPLAMTKPAVPSGPPLGTRLF